MRLVKNYLERLVPVDDSHLTITEGKAMVVTLDAHKYLNYKIPTSNSFSPLILKIKYYSDQCQPQVYWSRREVIPTADKHDGRYHTPHTISIYA